jgi:hypothetical protein
VFCRAALGVLSAQPADDLCSFGDAVDCAIDRLPDRERRAAYRAFAGSLLRHLKVRGYLVSRNDAPCT